MTTPEAPTLPPRHATVSAPTRSLSLFDSTSIVVGVIIGATIYESSPAIAGSVPNLAALVGVWVVGALIALVGALCYAELATAYPASGGAYIYLGHAFGRRMATLFAWAELCVVRPGSIGAVAFVFAHYANELFPLGDGWPPLLIYAVGSIVALSLVNLAGLREGKWTQNILATTKVLGLLLLFAVAIAARQDSRPTSSAAAEGASDWAQALILVMFAYGGWNEVSYVAAEVRDPRRNLPRTLFLGVAVVAAVYVLANLSFAGALGWQGFRSSPAVAADAVGVQWGQLGARLISALICITTLGSVNGQIFTGARIYYAFGRDHPLASLVGHWNQRTNAPSWALVVQCGVCLIPVVIFGVHENAFQSMVNYTTPVFWFFFFLVGVSVFLLRKRQPAATAPFRVPCYPVTPLVFVASSLMMLYATADYAVKKKSPEAWWAIGILAVGYLVTLVTERRSPASTKRRN
jgi:basic amino acid/polyamine antiporter, APA family